jgi:hypothetical protein
MRMYKMREETENNRLALSAIVKPLNTHSLLSAGASMEQAFACWMNASLMIFTVKPTPFFAPSIMLAAVSLNLTGDDDLLEHAIDIIGGLGQTWLNQLVVKRTDKPVKQTTFNKHGWRPYLNGAKLNSPFVPMLLTNAIGLGTIPLIIRG